MKRFLRCTVFVLTICLLVVGVVVAAENELNVNLFTNSGFEEKATSLRDMGAAKEWPKSVFVGENKEVEYKLDTGVYHSGKSSQRIRGKAASSELMVRASVARYLVDVNPGEQYKFSVWVKFKDIVKSDWWTLDKPAYVEERQDTGEVTPVALRLTWADRNHQGLKTAVWGLADMSNDDWQRIELIVDVPTDESFSSAIEAIRIDLFLFYSNGTVWWDDFEVLRLK